MVLLLSNLIENWLHLWTLTRNCSIRVMVQIDLFSKVMQFEITMCSRSAGKLPTSTSNSVYKHNIESGHFYLNTNLCRVINNQLSTASTHRVLRFANGTWTDLFCKASSRATGYLLEWTSKSVYWRCSFRWPCFWKCFIFRWIRVCVSNCLKLFLVITTNRHSCRGLKYFTPCGKFANTCKQITSTCLKFPSQL